MFNKFSYHCLGILGLLASIHVDTIFAEQANKQISEIAALEECSAQYKMDSSDVDVFLRDWSLSPTVTKDLKCVFGCIFDKLGMIKDKKIIWENVKLGFGLETSLERETEQQVVKACETQVKDGAEFCELGYSLIVCLKEELIKIYQVTISESELPWFELSATVMCQKKFNVSDEDAFGEIFKVSDKPNAKCMFRCLDEMMGYINRTTKKFDWDFRVKRERLRCASKPDFEEKAVGIIQNCRQKVNTDIEDACESSYLVMDCYMGQIRKYMDF